jgi:hypothetical protein
MTLQINIIDVNEKPEIMPTIDPDSTSKAVRGLTGRETGPLHIGVPKFYSGSIYTFVFNDFDADDTPDIADFKQPILTATTPAGGKNPFTIAKIGTKCRCSGVFPKWQRAKWGN